MNTPNEINIDFLGGESYKHYFSPFRKIHSIREAPGLYSWHLRLMDGRDYKNYIEFFHQISLKAKIEGNIRLKYEGELSKKFDIPEEPSDIKTLQSSIISTGYPLYVGISRNIKKRLEAHKEQFLKHKKDDSRNNEYVNSIQVDSEEESSFFGGRLAAMWPKSLSEYSLYVKYIMPEKCIQKRCSTIKCLGECLEDTMQNLRLSETFINSLFNPVFGRR